VSRQAQIAADHLDVAQPLVEPLRPLTPLTELVALVPLPEALELLPLLVTERIAVSVSALCYLRMQALVRPQRVHRLDALLGVPDYPQIGQRRAPIDSLGRDDQATVHTERLLVLGHHSTLTLRARRPGRRLSLDCRLKAVQRGS